MSETPELTNAEFAAMFPKETPAQVCEELWSWIVNQSVVTNAHGDPTIMPVIKAHALLSKQIAEIDRLKEHGKTCEWAPCDPEYMSDWETSCGRAWTFEEDGPVENRMHFCMGCGGRVVIKGGTT